MAFNCGEILRARLLAISGLVTRPPIELKEQPEEIVQLIESQEKAEIAAATLAPASVCAQRWQAPNLRANAGSGAGSQLLTLHYYRERVNSWKTV